MLRSDNINCYYIGNSFNNLFYFLLQYMARLSG